MAAKATKKQSLLDTMAGVSVSVTASDEGLSKVANIAQQQWDKAVEIADLEDKLKKAKEAYRVISEVDLPEAMRECGVKEFTTEGDLVLKLKDDVHVNVKVENRPVVFDWLVKHKFGGLIKSSIEIKFDREKLKEAQKLAKDLQKQGFEVDFQQSIHAATLKSFVKEQLAIPEAKGKEPFPKELFGALPYSVAEVKPKKKK